MLFTPLHSATGQESFDVLMVDGTHHCEMPHQITAALATRRLYYSPVVLFLLCHTTYVHHLRVYHIKAMSDSRHRYMPRWFSFTGCSSSPVRRVSVL